MTDRNQRQLGTSVGQDPSKSEGGRKTPNDNRLSRFSAVRGACGKPEL